MNGEIWEECYLAASMESITHYALLHGGSSSKTFIPSRYSRVTLGLAPNFLCPSSVRIQRPSTPPHSTLPVSLSKPANTIIIFLPRNTLAIVLSSCTISPHRSLPLAPQPLTHSTSSNPSSYLPASSCSCHSLPASFFRIFLLCRCGYASSRCGGSTWYMGSGWPCGTLRAGRGCGRGLSWWL